VAVMIFSAFSGPDTNLSFKFNGVHDTLSGFTNAGKINTSVKSRIAGANTDQSAIITSYDAFCLRSTLVVEALLVVTDDATSRINAHQACTIVMNSVARIWARAVTTVRSSSIGIGSECVQTFAQTGCAVIGTTSGGTASVVRAGQRSASGTISNIAVVALAHVHGGVEGWVKRIGSKICHTLCIRITVAASDKTIIMTRNASRRNVRTVDSRRVCVIRPGYQGVEQSASYCVASLGKRARAGSGI